MKRRSFRITYADHTRSPTRVRTKATKSLKEYLAMMKTLMETPWANVSETTESMVHLYPQDKEGEDLFSRGASTTPVDREVS